MLCVREDILVVRIGNLFVIAAVLVIYGKLALVSVVCGEHIVRSGKTGRRSENVDNGIVKGDFAVIFYELHVLVKAQYRGSIVVYSAARTVSVGFLYA